MFVQQMEAPMNFYEELLIHSEIHSESLTSMSERNWNNYFSIIFGISVTLLRPSKSYLVLSSIWRERSKLTINKPNGVGGSTTTEMLMKCQFFDNKNTK